ncbi:hypothetical protein B6672_004660 [Campylobacter jejuni]
MAGFHFKPLNLLFAVKIILAFGILSLVVFSLFCHFILKKKNPLGAFIHPFVFVLCIAIVILAKLMNYFLYLAKKYSAFKMWSIDKLIKQSKLFHSMC